ncbi:MAG: DUF5666 domain-containing protein [Candidatus Nomurabacteria bacterium]|nr:DUF5666 domain-containing protein [Candidatus Nomurabacteria bacterium]
MKKSIIKISLFALLLILSTGSVFAVGKIGPKKSHVLKNTTFVNKMIFGKVTNITGNVLTVTTNRKNGATYTVDTSSATFKKGDAIIKISDVALNDMVIVHSATEISGKNIKADFITDGLPQFNSINIAGAKKLTNQKNNFVFGTVAAIDGNNISINEQKGKETSVVTITVDANTKFEKIGSQNSTLADVAVGNKIMAMTHQGITTVRIMPEVASMGIKNINQKKNNIFENLNPITLPTVPDASSTDNTDTIPTPLQ